MTKALDPVTLTVIQNGLQQVCSEMDLTQEKASFSPVIAEAYDRSNGIYGATNGDVIAQGDRGLPIFVGVLQSTTREIIARCGQLGPDDVVLVNDPYIGGTHLMDVRMVRPFFYRDRLWCYLANAGHWPDTGGMVPGGFSSSATEIIQEGLRIPPVRFIRNGEIDRDILSIVLSNIRVPEERIGDITAQIGALKVGERRLTELIDQHGEEVVSAAIEELADRSERLMRAKLQAVPDGCYYAQAQLDSDGLVDERLTIKVAMTIDGDSARFDFTGSSPPCRGPLNSVWSTTLTAVYIAMKHIFPEVPINAGCFRPIAIASAKGTFLHAEYPRPVAGCAAEVSQRIMEAIFLAMAQAMPERMFAPPAGTSGNFSLGGHDPQTGRDFVMYLFSGGGYGAWAGGDGLTNGCPAVGISKTQPIEILEDRYPILFEEYALREGSAGAGQWRGGFGINYRMRLLRGEAVASFLMDHGLTPPPGIAGGEPGALNEIELTIGGKSLRPAHVSKGDGFRLSPGDRVQVRTPGGGGYGPASRRSAALVGRDITRGYYRSGEPLARSTANAAE